VLSLCNNTRCLCTPATNLYPFYILTLNDLEWPWTLPLPFATFSIDDIKRLTVALSLLCDFLVRVSPFSVQLIRIFSAIWPNKNDSGAICWLPGVSYSQSASLCRIHTRGWCMLLFAAALILSNWICVSDVFTKLGVSTALRVSRGRPPLILYWMTWPVTTVAYYCHPLLLSSSDPWTEIMDRPILPLYSHIQLRHPPCHNTDFTNTSIVIATIIIISPFVAFYHILN